MRKLTPEQMLGEPARAFLADGEKVLATNAAAEAPQDTGDLSKSMVGEIDHALPPFWVRVGSTLPYAEFVETGTRPHWPPLAALQGWADRHGIPAFLVARAIAEHGTAPNPFMERAIEKSIPDLQVLLKKMARDIERVEAL
jgi:hypothetical protein